MCTCQPVQRLHLLLQVVHAQMVIWVAVVVLFTLTVNASALGPLMSALGLNKTTPAQRHMHRWGSVVRLNHNVAPGGSFEASAHLLIVDSSAIVLAGEDDVTDVVQLILQLKKKGKSR